jgi:uncharacterized protein YktA (UPF0223 family)
MQLPVIDRAIDNTALSGYMRCPRKYKLSMIENWRIKEVRQALSFGAFWHRLLETHYKTGGDKAQVLSTYTKYKDEVPDQGDYRTADRALIEYNRYVKRYGLGSDIFATVGYPDSPMVEISTAIESDTLIHEYAGKIDRVIKVGDLYYIEDHKTTSRFHKAYFKEFDLSNQIKGYVWIARQLLPEYPIAGARINLAHILTNKSDFHRHLVTFSDSQIEEWERNTNSWIRRIEESTRNDDFPAHFGDNGCSGKFGRCEYFDVCSTNETIRAQVLAQDFEQKVWDPLALGEE